MILSNLKYSDKFEGLHPGFKMVFDYIKSHDMLKAEDGKIILDGDNVFINVVTKEAKEKGKLEIHKDYIDIQIIMEGEEYIGWKAEDRMSSYPEPYNAEKDIAFSDEESEIYVPLKQFGDFAILYPEDGHAPLVGKGTIRKLIAKIKI